MFALAYMGRKRWAKPRHCFSRLGSWPSRVKRVFSLELGRCNDVTAKLWDLSLETNPIEQGRDFSPETPLSILDAPLQSHS